jgi:hypothetical protein
MTAGAKSLRHQRTNSELQSSSLVKWYIPFPFLESRGSNLHSQDAQEELPRLEKQIREHQPLNVPNIAEALRIRLIYTTWSRVNN